ncbi:hypothetical protein [Stakelama pacifica]|uniref:Uncharacterized protein n=1 Tax=Stakelama pacifica TaxID=517720 RepID=A0A4R6FXE3_9SPHN|nr:hypothetical protein [Stakelama pacifica]TDN85685.1 hypothetical protein EV664_102394 [Stakelama pacifica]GGO91933.1 hypothetical protein GCM10011329_07780 [Stakelama pacifica]
MKTHYWAWVGAVATLALAGSAFYAVGQVYSDAKAIDLINQLSQAGLYFGSAIATASATTLALMLTLIGMARRAEAEFGAHFYRNIYRVSRMATATLLGSVVLLLLLTLPVGEFEGLSDIWFIWLYRALFALIGLLSALLVATVLLVFTTVRDVIVNITPTEMV